MAETLNMTQKFDPELVKDLFNKVRGKSSLAALCAQEPIEFVGNTVMVFSMDNEVALVAEGESYGHGGVAVKPVKIVPVEIEYGARISDRFMTASEEEKLDMLEAYNNGFAAKVGRGIDIIYMHGKNPRTNEQSDLITSYFDKIEQTVPYDAAAPDDCVDDAIALTGDWDVTGIAMAKSFASALGKKTNENGTKMYPGLSWGGDPKEVNGIPSSVNSTVSFGDSEDMAIVGDFANCIKWGYAKDMTITIIPYGDPDNSGKDLAGHGQIYIRAKAYVGLGILVPEAFARVVKEGA
ncbi:MAG: phage major capsid protein [Oscillospiraceae bacterium]|nr:phage major capsid protein [Oscillospiraceae bacterium]MBR6595169.1 phage major capsid protein [Oscillospiraceae bacterium]